MTRQDIPVGGPHSPADRNLARRAARRVARRGDRRADRRPREVPVARPLLGEEEIAAAVRVLRSGRVVQGPEVAAFEEEFADLVDGRICVAVNSGTSGLHLALLALGIGPGDEVIVPSFTFAATANAVRLAGATPVFADIEPDSYCLDPRAVASAIGPATAAIMPVHLYGHPAPMDGLVRLARRHGLAVVEDAAQAHAAALGGRPVGTFGDAAVFSLYPTKNMHSLEGGMVVVPDGAVARTLRLLRNQGMERRYDNEIVGFNVRMTDVAAAIGREQLRKLPMWTDRRRAHARTLDAGLRGVVVPTVADGAAHVYHQYTVRVVGDGRSGRDAFQRALARRGVGSAVYYPIPVHRLPSFRHPAGRPPADLPETDRAADEVLSLPVHPSLDPADLAHVLAAVNAIGAAR
ncbi:DegT/DnrJ/EryC1/StrS family aminotransferase [Allostreptomyces psammosilenae]|uniref:dTDP-4-amino-4,6-dideoxygalactose transaminase n=1 Tax=Allostreptomyces psammosilenae TaxID=1892865 RepID=A0A853A4T3_9ACTN|nr:DegT/DnrJ/EryC1/StrS family aminotransferase [Allostreptomyces psammosilenae]NYI08480.1 dTDP-4-amino-4,6-dideoxygalactose transaminase [Allostreptomyces psammosilenae]